MLPRPLAPRAEPDLLAIAQVALVRIAKLRRDAFVNEADGDLVIRLASSLRSKFGFVRRRFVIHSRKPSVSMSGRR